MTTPFPRPRASRGPQLQPHERRGLTRYKLAAWDRRLMCWVDGKDTHETEAMARAAARRPGRYQVSTITDKGRRDGEPFEVVKQ